MESCSGIPVWFWRLLVTFTLTFVMTGCVSTPKRGEKLLNGENIILEADTWSGDYVLTDNGFYEVSKKEDGTYDVLFGCSYSETKVRKATHVPQLIICNRYFRFEGCCWGYLKNKVYETIVAQEEKIGARSKEPQSDASADIRV